MRFIAASSCAPQSQRAEWNTSPVKQQECTRTRDVLAVADLATHERHVGPVVDLTLEGMDVKGTVLIGRQFGGCRAFDQRLGTHPVLDQIGDRNEGQAVTLRELRELGNARHGAVFVHDLADDTGGVETRNPRQIDGRLGLTGAHQHPAGTRPERVHVARPCEVGGPGGRSDGRPNGGRPIMSRDAGRGY